MLAYKFGAIALLSALAFSSAICAPQQQQSSSGQQQTTGKHEMGSVLQSRAGSGASSSKQATTTTTSSPPTQTSTSANLLASASTTMKSTETLGTGASIAKPNTPSEKSDSSSGDVVSATNFEPLDSYEGRDPFGDDSLWQIPAYLARDLSSLQDDKGDEMAREASSSPEAATEDQEEDLGEPIQLSAGSTSISASQARRPSSYQDIASVVQNGGKQPQASVASKAISAAIDLKTAAGYHYPAHGYGYDDDDHHYHHQPAHHPSHIGAHYGGKYFQYASVPKPGAWEFGYRRGNPKHTIEHYEQGKGSHFQAKVKWTGKHGYGVHVFDYNHGDHHGDHHYDGDHYDDTHHPSPKYQYKKHHHYGHH